MTIGREINKKLDKFHLYTTASYKDKRKNDSRIKIEISHIFGKKITNHDIKNALTVVKEFYPNATSTFSYAYNTITIIANVEKNPTSKSSTIRKSNIKPLLIVGGVTALAIYLANKK
jgi:hypothetical protein